jgi:hypothetical protein
MTEGFDGKSVDQPRHGKVRRTYRCRRAEEEWFRAHAAASKRVMLPLFLIGAERAARIVSISGQIEGNRAVERLEHAALELS